MEGETIQKRCEKCGSTQTYITKITGERFCRNCGHRQKLVKEETEE
jgi:uncharacterized Zn finger protein (UPF0148 family)